MDLPGSQGTQGLEGILGPAGELEEVAAVLLLKVFRHSEDLDVEAAILTPSKVGAIWKGQQPKHPAANNRAVSVRLQAQPSR